MRVCLTDGALADIDEQLAFLAEMSPSAANKLQARIEELLNLLREFPEAGPETDEPGVRRVNTTPFRHFILYEIADQSVVVLALRHGARSPDMPTSRYSK